MKQKDWTKMNEQSHCKALQTQDIEHRKLIRKLQHERDSLKKQLALCNVSSCALDYSLKKGEYVWFTFKSHPKKEDWIKAEILDLNWAYKSAAIKLNGFSGVISTGIEALHRERHCC